MNTFTNDIGTRPVQTVFKLACIAAILAGCGGGGTGGTNTTSSFASGPIQGLGSIIVNGVRFDDSSASVASDDDDNNEVHKSGDLKVGMVVTIQGGAITTDDSGARHSKATEVHFGSELVGPAKEILRDAGGLTGRFTVLGQVVTVDQSTVFDNSILNGFAGLTLDMVVEVHGLFNAARTSYTATRIEAKATASDFKIRGAIEAPLTPTTFVIGGKTINFSSIVPPPSLKLGQIVRVKVQKAPTSGGELMAIRIKSGERKIEDHDEVEIKGAVSNLSDDKKSFDIGTQHVDASAAVLSTLRNGDFVEVEGRLSGGNLVAKKVSLEDENAPGAGEFEFHRKITTSSGQNIVFGTGDTATTITWDGNTSFEKGATSASLTPNTCVEVKAVTVSGATTLRATRIKLDNSCTQ